MERQTGLFSIGFLAAAAALLLFAWLANEVLHGATAGFDAALRAEVHSWASPRLTVAMKGMTQLGAPPFIISAGLLAVWRLAAAGRRRAAMALVVSTFGAEALDQILKLVFRRPRPEPFFGIVEPSTYSFPSGHAITSACFYGVLAAILAARTQSLPLKICLWGFAATMAFLIGLSRVYLGVHYPSDVLAGYAAAVIWIGAVREGYLAWIRRSAALSVEKSRPRG